MLIIVNHKGWLEHQLHSDFNRLGYAQHRWIVCAYDVLDASTSMQMIANGNDAFRTCHLSSTVAYCYCYCCCFLFPLLGEFNAGLRVISVNSEEYALGSMLCCHYRFHVIFVILSVDQCPNWTIIALAIFFLFVCFVWFLFKFFSSYSFFFLAAYLCQSDLVTKTKY